MPEDCWLCILRYPIPLIILIPYLDYHNTFYSTIFLKCTSRKVGSEWLFSESTIEQIPVLYRATFSSTLEAFIDRLPLVAKTEWMGLYVWQVIGLFVWILLALVIRNLFERILTQYLSGWAKKTRIEWDNLLLESVQKPLGLVVLISFLLLSYTNLQFGVSINLYLSKILSISLSIAIFWVLYNLIDVLQNTLRT